MNPTIVRRALWVVAVLAFGYTVFAFWEWRPTELVIAAGVFVTCIPVDLLLAREEREHRARARTPFGPLQQYGVRTYRSESPFWEIDADAIRLQDSRREAGMAWRERQDAFNDAAGGLSYNAQGTTRSIAMTPGRRPRGPWWRRLYRRVTRPWWVAALSPLLLIAAVPFAEPADALVIYPRITITVVWTGAPECIQAWEPAGGDNAKPIALCSSDQWWSQSYQAPPVGNWIGVDPEMSGAETLSCTVAVNGNIVMDDFAVRGDGHDATCLGRW